MTPGLLGVAIAMSMSTLLVFLSGLLLERNVLVGHRALLSALRVGLPLLIVGTIITIATGVLTAPRLSFDENGLVIPVAWTGYPLPWLVTFPRCGPPPEVFCDGVGNRVDWTLLSLDTLLYPLLGYLLLSTYGLVRGALFGKRQLLHLAG